MIKMYIGLQVHVIFVGFQRNLNFLDRFLKNTKISINTKIRPVGTELFRAEDGRTDGQSDMTKLIVGFHNFANAPKSLLYSKDYYTTKLEPSLIPTTCM